MTGILSGIRVVDFSRYVAGPLCATILGDYGADVIRVDRMGGSEDRDILPVAEGASGALFQQMGRGKRSIAIDQRREEADLVIDKLIASADVIVTSVPPFALEKVGLDYPRLKSIRQDIILANVSAYSADGPWAKRGGFDSIGQAMSGVAYLSGERGQPMRQQVTWVDHSTGLFSAIGVLLALMERQRSGRGADISASLVGSATMFNAAYLLEQSQTDINREATGNRSTINGPTDMFKCTDGNIITQVVGDGLFKRWAGLMDEPHLLKDPRFASDISRGQNGKELTERMGRWCAERTCEEALEQLATARIPAGPVLTPGAALAHPQLRGMGLFQEVAAQGLDTPATLVRIPISTNGEMPEITRPAPLPGEHTDAILSELGFDASQITKLKQGGVVQRQPQS